MQELLLTFARALVREPGRVRVRERREEGRVVLELAVAPADRGRGIGRIRLPPLGDASAKSLGGFVGATIAPGSVVATDDWSGYGSLASVGYTHRVLPAKDLALPHLVASLVKRWLLGTYQGAVKPTHLVYYLDEFTFRFNRRTSRSRGKLFYRLVQHAVLVDPVSGDRLNAAIPAAPDEDFDDLDAWGAHDM